MTTADFLGPIGNNTAKYDTGNPALRWLLNRFFRQVETSLRLASPGSLLDVGCGDGEATERIARFLPAAKIVGVDDGSLADKWQPRTTEWLTFQPGSGYKLPFPDASFDCVCALEVLEHVDRPQDMLAEMRRVSSRWLLVSVPHEPLWRASHLLAGRDVRAWGNTPGHINHWNRRSFQWLLSGYGRIERLAAPFPWLMVLEQKR